MLDAIYEQDDGLSESPWQAWVESRHNHARTTLITEPLPKQDLAAGHLHLSD
jgi:hypothetical protein